MNNEVFKTIIQNIDILTLALTIAVAVIGWIFALWLQRHNARHQHKIQIRYDIYKQFVEMHKAVQNTVGKLGASSSSPLILMESSMIPFQLGLKKQYKDVWLPYNEHECVFEGEQKWTLFAQKLYDLYFDFSNKFQDIHYLTENWSAPLKSLLPTRDVLIKEVGSLKKQINEQLGVLRLYPTDHGRDWRKWDQEDVKKIMRSINDDAMEIGSYLHDFMVLIHNELLSSYFGYKRLTRKTIDPKCKVLIRGAIVENVDWPMVRKTEKWKEEIVFYANEQLQKSSPPNGNIQTDYEKFLRSVAGEICPSCNTSITVMSSEKTADSFCYRYTCGHSWQGVYFHETISIKELLKIKSVREGFGLLRKILHGWKPTRGKLAKKLPDGVQRR